MSADQSPTVVEAGGQSPLTRQEKLIQRTKVGAALAGSVAALLYAASLEEGPQITLALAVVLSFWSLLEVRKMGLFTSTQGFIAASLSCIALAAALLRWEDFAQNTEPGEPVIGETAPMEGPFLLIAALALPFSLLMVRRIVQLQRKGIVPTVKSVPSALLMVTVAVPLLALYHIRLSGGAAGLAAYIVLAKIGDIAGYYVGSLMGKRRPFPNISPGKSVAGCNASLAVGILTGVLFVAFGVLDGARYGLLSGALLGAAVNVLAQAGDLLESAYKRRAGFKDSGTTFGPSGGMFDLIDSLILSAPVAAVLWALLFQSTP